MKLYPKQLFGPSSLGTGQARALAARGGDYQWSQRDSSTVVRQQGEFQRVLVSGAEYAASGFVRADRYRTTAGQRYFTPFLPSPELGPVTYLGQGEYFARVRDPDASGTVGQVHNYTVWAGETQLFSTTVRTNAIGVTLRSFYGLRRTLGVQTLRFSRANAVPLGTIFQLAPALTFISARGDKTAMFAALTDQGRIDSSGRPLFDPSFFFWRKTGVSDGFALTAGAFTRPNAEFCEFMPSFEVGGSTYTLLAERFFFPGPTSPTTNYAPRYFMFVAPDNDYDLLSALDATTALFPNDFIPTPTPAGTPAGSPERYGVNDGALRDGLLGNTMALMRAVTLPGGVALLFYPHFTRTAGVQRWATRVARVTNSPFGITLVREQLGAAGSLSLARYVQSAVHLGNGAVLVKTVLGFNGAGFAVQFERSYDAGVTWEVLPPTGFSVPAQNQFFGDLVVHRARTADDFGIVLITAWDVDSQSYHVYESKDDGASWSRKGRVARPDVFRRVDTMIAGDGGENFQTLYPGPDPAREADVTLPGRYTS